MWIHLIAKNSKPVRKKDGGIYLRIFPECCKQYNIEETVINTSTMESCNAMQESITHLLQKLMSKYAQFLMDSHSPLCELMCLQVRTGDVALKKVSILQEKKLIQIAFISMDTSVCVTFTFDLYHSSNCVGYDRSHVM